MSSPLWTGSLQGVLWVTKGELFPFRWVGGTANDNPSGPCSIIQSRMQELFRPYRFEIDFGIPSLSIPICIALPAEAYTIQSTWRIQHYIMRGWEGGEDSRILVPFRIVIRLKSVHHRLNQWWGFKNAGPVRCFSNYAGRSDKIYIFSAGCQPLVFAWWGHSPLGFTLNRIKVFET